MLSLMPGFTLKTPVSQSPWEPLGAQKLPTVCARGLWLGPTATFLVGEGSLSVAALRGKASPPGHYSSAPAAAEEGFPKASVTILFR